MPESPRLLVGIGASDEHTICILNPDRKVLDERNITYSGTGIGQLADQLMQLSGDDPGKLWSNASLRSMQLTRNRWIAFVTGIPWRGRRTTGGMLLCWPMRCAPICIYSTACVWIRHRSFACESYRGPKKMCSKTKSAPETGYETYSIVTIRKC